MTLTLRHGSYEVDVPVPVELRLDAAGEGTPPGEKLPDAFAFSAAYPNPFTQTTTFDLDVAEVEDLRIISETNPEGLRGLPGLSFQKTGFAERTPE